MKRERKGRHAKALAEVLQATLTLLASDETLPTSLRDHALTGNWKTLRDCHLKPDLVLIYKKRERDVLELLRLGSHSELGL